MKYVTIASYLTFLILCTIQFAVSPLNLVGVILLTITGGHALFITFPRQFRDEMDGITDMFLFIMSVMILLITIWSWWHSQEAMVRTAAGWILGVITHTVTQ